MCSWRKSLISDIRDSFSWLGLHFLSPSKKVNYTVNCLQILQDFYSVPDHFRTLQIKELIILKSDDYAKSSLYFCLIGMFITLS